MTRIDLVPANTENEAIRPLFDRMKKRWGDVIHLYRALAWSPALLSAWGPFAFALRFDLDASRRLRELLIIEIGRQTGANYEYQHHLKMALEEGITMDQVDVLPDW